MVTEDATASHDGHHDRPKASYDDINVPVILTVGFVSAVLTFFCIVGVQALFYHYERSEITEKSYGSALALPEKQIIDEQKAKLMTYGHTVEEVDGEDGKVEVTRITIPLEEAIEKTLAEQKKAQEEAYPSASE